MFKKNRVVWSGLTRIIAGSSLILLYLLVGTAASQGKDHEASPPNNSICPTPDSQHATDPTAATTASSEQSVIPPGTILPVRLQNTISSDKSKPGQIIFGKIVQEVPLPNGSVLRKGTKIEGHIVEVTPAGTASGSKISLRFDKVYSRDKMIPVTTDLRAIAGFMTVQEAGVPEEAPSEGTPYTWLTTTQIGGDSVYGLGGPVMSAENPSEVVGKSVNDGVLSRVSAKEGTNCRGPIDGNNNPQALWVFSSDACGIYGMEHVKIAHAGRTDPVGTISLVSDGSKLKIPAATGILLRVNAPSREKSVAANTDKPQY